MRRASKSKGRRVCKPELLPYMLSIGNEDAFAVTKLKQDMTFVQADALTFLADEVTLVRLPRKPKKLVNKYPIQHDMDGLVWCGPAAVSAITGATTTQIRDLIRKHRKDPTHRVLGTTAEDLEYALRKLGHQVEYSYMYGGKLDVAPTLSQWIKETADERHEGLAYLISLQGEKKENCGHWAVILNDEYICSMTQKWVPLDKAKFKRRRVDTVYTIRRVK